MKENKEAEILELKKQIAALQQKCSAKTDTIVRLGQDLETSENEKKGFAARIETLERNLERTERELQLVCACENDMKIKYGTERQDLIEDLNKYKRENQKLRTDRQELLDEKADLKKDCKTFRQTIAQYEVEKMGGAIKSNFSSDGDELAKLGAHEKLQAKCNGLESDLRSMLGIKEELLLERDEMQRKVARLSNELSYLLNGDPRRSMVSRSPKAGDSDEKPSVAVINMKQIRELLASHAIELDESDYRAITTILLDLCNDKQMALAHSRRANKVLGMRLHEVESKLAVLDVKSRSSSPRHEPDKEIELLVPRTASTSTSE
uniref:GRIP domain-containing protein n=1 Tax=Caenorhabditis tropicalis TaxID=1561998 RepID=A0A1I7T994_9PELO